MKGKISLFWKTFIRTLIPFAIIMSVLVVMFIASRFLLTLTVWQATDPMYKLFKGIESFCINMFPAICIIIFIFVSFRCLYKTYDYLDIMYKSMEGILTNKGKLVKFPEELSELEIKINQVIIKAEENERNAQEAEQRKNDLVMYLAHDLKTPLTSVIGYLTLLNEESEISDELREKYLSISLDKAERLEDLINEFFEITRFNLTHIVLEYTKINLSRMLEQLQYEFIPMFKSKNLVCELDIDKNIMVKCDPDKIQRVFDNLLRNAVNYSFDNSKITISAKLLDDKVNILFRNHGDTIPQEKLGRVFEQFYRLDSSRASKSGGAGLGLAISKQIVELHGGSINAISEDEIIEFSLCIPTALENR